ncbi:cupin domain-containing protein [Roseomonas xinghualingensis]|uniref:cupin domain-containing protein n=1 Tax=Roseomonas xinghualingensis TaxID=2986475 RepID=UPI0021F18DD7|nr:cupin domain-containing protein [Roseomonas sp. SXEYE001]MCV4206625.1 cupin domain-containing protein [Roseomonas sp. SXEYE001]
MSEPLRCRIPAVATVQADDEIARVTRWDFPPGSETGWHRHGWGYLVVPVTDGTMLLEEPGGTTREAQIKAGISYTRAPGIEHNVINAGTVPFSFVEIEFKARPG